MGPIISGCILLYLLSFVICSLSTHHENTIGIKVLNVGEELVGETLPLKRGQRMYHLHGLKESKWYEVKISYPASIPTSFSIQLKSNLSEYLVNKNRRLLNTEKSIFKYDDQHLNSRHNGMYVLVSVEAEGIVAKPDVEQREVVLFNIVCDELSLGIPHKAWWVGIAAFICLLLASAVPCFLPPLLKNPSTKLSNQAITKSL